MASVKFNLYRLSFPAGLHINSGKDHNEKGDELIHSDTFIAALISSLAKMGVTISGDEFVVSSLFPWIRTENGLRYFLPVPFLPPPAEKQDVQDSKKWKKVRWMDTELWCKLINGDDHLNAQPTGKFLSTDPSITDPMHKGLRPRNKVGVNWEEDTEPYYIDELHFQKNAGLYFLYDAADSRNSEIQKAMDLLSSEGIGTDRSVGKGFFEFEADSIEISFPDSADYAMSLGMFLPESADQLNAMLDENSSFQLKLRGGWISTPDFIGKKKNNIYMFAAGSVFRISTKGNPEIVGRVTDLSPSENIGLYHKIFRSGRSLFVPVKMP